LRNAIDVDNTEGALYMNVVMSYSYTVARRGSAESQQMQA